jgi:4-hydroxy-tetrahydrodipicolinate reductase
MLNIALVGAGRMGQAIMREIAVAGDLRLAAVCVRDGRVPDARIVASDAGFDRSVQIVSDPRLASGMADVVIDFSLPDAATATLDAALAAGKPLVSGVTGLDDHIMAAMRHASTVIPVLYDRNMSIGIAVMQKLVQQAAESLGGDFAVSVSETHHRHKIDAPSGTALKLGEALARSRGELFANVYHYDPDGSKGEPPAGAIVFHATRSGEHPGEHVVTFSSESESVELKHAVTSRQLFARGALRAARWLAGQEPGLYSIADITG